MKATLLFKTDFHHAFVSRELIGVFTNKRKFISAANKLIKEDLKNNPEGKEGEELKDYITWNQEFFIKQNQTQGLSSFELVYEEIELNTML